MSMTAARTAIFHKLAIAIALSVLAGCGGTSEPESEAARNVLQFEAAGVDYAGWPEMDVTVNGQKIASLTIDSQQRKKFAVDVPNDIETVSTVDVKFTNPTGCQNVLGGCDDRKIIVRGLYLNDKKIEGAEASGENNLPSLLRTSDGGISWRIE